MRLSHGGGAKVWNTNLSLQTQLADSLTIQPGLFRCSRRGQFNLHQYVSICLSSTWYIVTHIVCPKVVQCLGNLNLLLGVEEGVCELFTLTQRTLNDLKSRYIAQEVADWLVWVVSGRLDFVLDGGVAWVGWKFKSVIETLEQENI